MKVRRRATVGLVICVAALSLCACEVLGAVTIGPESGHVIVIGRDATVVSGFAAKELQLYLKRITGHEFPILTEDKVTYSSAPMIFVGPSQRTEGLNVKIGSDLPE